MKWKGVEFAGVILTALVTGVFWGTWFTLTRSIENFPPESFIAIGKTIIRNVALPMSILMPATLLCMLSMLWLLRRERGASFYIYFLSLILMVITLLITVGVEVPIDNEIKNWTVNTIPQDWEELRARWDRFHTIRTFTSIASLALFVWGLLTRRREPSAPAVRIPLVV